MQFYTQFVRPDKVPFLEPGGGERIVETIGYRPAEVQIQEMINAGIRLQIARAERYEYPPGSKELEHPEDLEPGLDARRNIDLADVYRAQEYLRARLAALKEQKNAKKEVEEPKAQVASQEVK